MRSIFVRFHSNWWEISICREAHCKWKWIKINDTYGLCKRISQHIWYGSLVMELITSQRVKSWKCWECFQELSIEWNEIITYIMISFLVKFGSRRGNKPKVTNFLIHKAAYQYNINKCLHEPTYVPPLPTNNYFTHFMRRNIF